MELIHIPITQLLSDVSVRAAIGTAQQLAMESQRADTVAPASDGGATSVACAELRIEAITATLDCAGEEIEIDPAESRHAAAAEIRELVAELDSEPSLRGHEQLRATIGRQLERAESLDQALRPGIDTSRALLRQALEELPCTVKTLTITAWPLHEIVPSDLAVAALVDQLQEAFDTEWARSELESHDGRNLSVLLVVPDGADLTCFRAALQQRSSSFVDLTTERRRPNTPEPGTNPGVESVHARLDLFYDTLLAMKEEQQIAFSRESRRRATAQRFLYRVIPSFEALSQETQEDLLAGEMRYGEIISGDADEAAARQAGNSYAAAVEREKRRYPNQAAARLPHFSKLRNDSNHADSFDITKLEKMRVHLYGLDADRSPGLICIYAKNASRRSQENTFNPR